VEKQREIFGLDPRLFLGVVITGVVAMVFALFLSLTVNQRAEMGELRAKIEKLQETVAKLERLEESSRERAHRTAGDLFVLNCELQSGIYDPNQKTCQVGKTIRRLPPLDPREGQ